MVKVKPSGRSGRKNARGRGESGRGGAGGFGGAATVSSARPDAAVQFDEQDEDEVEESVERQKLIRDHNRKNKKSGGFQAMGLSNAIFKGILQKGYKIPTPIQRKAVPIILEGKDVVAMARTGSGKTAAFLIPMFERLKAHSGKAGARAIIMSPTRELALQTLKFTKELGKNTGLRAAVVLGGDRLDDQFEALHENPDIIIATPGRFMHIVLEMDLKLNSVEYVVFDEADRLFEMGFQQQLQEMISRLPERRQTLLFSATLPKVLVEFAKAGLHEPTLIRLDVDTKLSENLQLAFLQCRSEEKPPILLYLLENVLKADAKSVVFVATKHHVEYLNALLTDCGIACACVYGAMDPTARKISVGKFQHGKVNVLLVTDLAARGIDIPLLDNVINYNFPDKGKLFVHRVGRVARAGRTGTAYSLVAPDETAYMIDLHLFLGRPVEPVPTGATASSMPGPQSNGLYGSAPRAAIGETDQRIEARHAHSVDLQNLRKVCANGYKQYLKSRQNPSSESVKRAKELRYFPLGNHPVFATDKQHDEGAAAKELSEFLKNWRGRKTIFEVNPNKKSSAYLVMQEKRKLHDPYIQANAEKRAKQQQDWLHRGDDGHHSNNTGASTDEGAAEEDSITAAFPSIIMPSKRPAGPMDAIPAKKMKREQRCAKDEENYVPYRPRDYQSEKGLGIGLSFEQQASDAVLNLAGDEDQLARQMDHKLKWDRKKKKFVREPTASGKNQGKIKTESGQWIPASYKSNVYREWLHKTKRAPVGATGGMSTNVPGRRAAADEDDGGDLSADDAGGRSGPSEAGKNQRRQQHVAGRGGKRVVVLGHKFGRHKKGADGEKGAAPFRKELRNKEEILKERRVKAKKLFQLKQRGKPQKRDGQQPWQSGSRGGSRGRGGKGGYEGSGGRRQGHSGGHGGRGGGGRGGRGGGGRGGRGGGGRGFASGSRRGRRGGH